MKGTLLPVLVLLSVSCSDDDPSRAMVAPSREEDEATLRAMYEDIFDFVADRSCTESRLCGAAAVGAKPCGGPNLYVVYSKQNVDWNVLHAKLNALRVFETELNIRHDRVSDCSTPSVPEPGCVKGVCVDTARSAPD